MTLSSEARAAALHAAGRDFEILSVNHLKDTRSNSKYGSNWFDSNLAHWACYRVLIFWRSNPKGKGTVLKTVSTGDSIFWCGFEIHLLRQKWFPEIWSELVRKRIANPSRWKSLPSSSLGISAIQRCITANNMIVSTFRAFSLVARALAAMLETLVRVQYKRAIACILIFHCPVAKTSYDSTLI